MTLMGQNDKPKVLKATWQAKRCSDRLKLVKDERLKGCTRSKWQHDKQKGILKSNMTDHKVF